MEQVSTDRYFIAILPPADISADARSLQEDMMSKYNTKAALRSPPHITLHMPFRWKNTKIEELTSLLSQFFSALEPFRISLDGIGAFPPRVIFLNVIGSKELTDSQLRLSRFCRVNLGLFNATRADQPFHPHMTLAFRDLRKPAFKLAWDEYRDRDYRATFDVDSAWLLRHDGHRWYPWMSFPLGSARRG